MARAPRKKKDAPLNAVGGNGGNLTHDTKNALTDDQVLALTLHHRKQYETALKAKKDAGAGFLRVTKLIKAELGADGVADIKDMIAADQDGYEERLRAELERKARVARWLGLEIGTQPGLFDPAAPQSQDERGFGEGKRAGLAGEICKPPFGAGTDGYDGYMRGWHEGSAVRTNMQSEQDEGDKLLRPAGNEPASEDAFDKAADGVPAPEPGAGTTQAATGQEVWPDDASIANRKPETVDA